MEYEISAGLSVNPTRDKDTLQSILHYPQLVKIASNYEAIMKDLCET